MADPAAATITQLKNIQARTGKTIAELHAALARSGAAPVSDADPLEAIYAGPKAGLRSLHEAVLQQLRAFGDFEVAPKKSYVSLRRKKQFAMIGPATKDSVEIGLNARDLPADARLKPQPAGSMCNATTRIRGMAEIDAQLLGWMRSAFDAAG